METFYVTKVSITFFYHLYKYLPPGGQIFFLLPLAPNLLNMNKGVRRFLPQEGFKWRKIVQYLLQGLLILAPLAVTIYFIYWIVSSVDSWIPIFREEIKDYQNHVIGHRVKNYGLGFLIILAAIIVIGYLSSVFIQSRIFNLFDRWLEKTPGVKYIYSSVRDFMGAFAGEKKKFNTPILANAFADDVWIMGFLTDEELQKFDMGAEMVSIYIPQAYHWAGQLYVLPRSRVRKLDKISSGDAMKYAVSGGVVDAEEDEEKK
jgi:uncharacterized membrane protein